MKYFVVADVHSYYDEMITALNTAGFDKYNKDHVFVSLGDLLDRGRKPNECLDFVLSLDRKILIRGNHEDMLDHVIWKKQCTYEDYINGTASTLSLITGQSDIDFNSIDDHVNLRNYLDSLITYYETDHYVFVHGWIPCNKLKIYSEDQLQYTPIENWRDTTRLNWSLARWINGMDAWNNGIRDNKTICCGHWHTSWGHFNLENSGSEFGDNADFSPFVADGIIALDACTTYSKKVNCIVLED